MGEDPGARKLCQPDTIFPEYQRDIIDRRRESVEVGQGVGLGAPSLPHKKIINAQRIIERRKSIMRISYREVVDRDVEIRKAAEHRCGDLVEHYGAIDIFRSNCVHDSGHDLRVQQHLEGNDDKSPDAKDAEQDSP